jgi:hypothetical protein
MTRAAGGEGDTAADWRVACSTSSRAVTATRQPAMGRTAYAPGALGAVPRRAQAAVVDALGPPAQSLRVREVDVGEPGTGQVLVRVEFAGVNFPDVLMVRRGRAQGEVVRLASPRSPLTP